MLRRPTVWLLLAFCLLAVACEPEEDPAPVQDASSPPDAPSPTAPPAAGSTEEPTQPIPRRDSDPDPPPCRDDRLEDGPVVLLTGTDPTALAARVAGRTHRCARLAVVAPTNGWAASLAVPVAIAEGAPLLLVDHDDVTAIHDRLRALDTETVIAVGLDLDLLEQDTVALTGEVAPGPLGPDDEELAPTDRGGNDQHDEGSPSAPTDDADRGDEEPSAPTDDADRGNEEPSAATNVALALAVADHLDTRRFVAVGDGDIASRTAGSFMVDASTALLPVPEDAEGLRQLARALPATARLEVVEGSEARALADALLSVGIDAEVSARPRWPDETAATTWLVDPAQPAAAAIAAVAAAGRGESVLPIDGSDLRAGRDHTAAIRDAAPSRVVVVGDVTSDAPWQLEVVRDGPTLPAGGFRLFDDHRIVALYGSPVHPQLGALGEQDLDATVERLRTAAEPYGTDGRRVLPAFELIATVASLEGGPQGDFSERTPLDELRPYIDRAAQEGFYVILDLQPGHTDFLDQAQEYEELLAEPHVGLALDPEWRIDADEAHLERIGHVEVEEVQRVADWLAELTREHRLPQKLLLLHQFTDGMLPDRDELAVPPELAVVIHMDGQGTLPAKLETFASISRGAEDDWVWGWKSFYDEDDPVATPERILELDPLPLVVTYQ